VEVIGDVSPGALVVTPARVDLKNGSRVRSDTPTRLASDAASGNAHPVAEDNANSASSEPVDLAAKSVDIAISSSLTAHIQSIVNDARKAAP
jgi:hypothetical protein